MRKRTRRLHLELETIAGRPTVKVGRSSNHPEDVIKVILADAEDPGRVYVLDLPLSHAEILAAAITRFVGGVQ